MFEEARESIPPAPTERCRGRLYTLLISQFNNRQLWATESLGKLHDMVIPNTRPGKQYYNKYRNRDESNQQVNWQQALCIIDSETHGPRILIPEHHRIDIAISVLSDVLSVAVSPEPSSHPHFLPCLTNIPNIFSITLPVSSMAIDTVTSNLKQDLSMKCYRSRPQKYPAVLQIVVPD